MKTTTRKPKQPVRPVHKKENSQSHFSLIGAKAGFTTEPLWYRLVVTIIIVIAVAVLGYILKEWALPAIAQHVFGGKVTQFINGFKGRAP